MALARMRPFPRLSTLIRPPGNPKAVEDVIGPIFVWTSTCFIKQPTSRTFAAWHQDGQGS